MMSHHVSVKRLYVWRNMGAIERVPGVTRTGLYPTLERSEWYNYGTATLELHKKPF